MMGSHTIRLLVITGFGVGGSIVNFIAQAVIAYRFGSGLDVDTYAFSLGMPTFVSGLLAICVSYVAVPALAGLAEKPGESRELSGAMLAIVVAIALLLAFAAIPAMLWQPALLLPEGSTIREEPHLTLLIAIAWLMGAVQVINALLVSRLNAVGRHIPAVILSLPPGAVSIAMLLTAPIEGIWIATFGLLLGTLAVTMIGFALQPRCFAWRPRALLAGRTSLPIPPSAWLSIIALTCFSSFALIDSYWAPRVGVGALSSLSYAQRILIGAGNLIIIGPSAIAVPILAKIAKKGDVQQFRQTAFSIVAGVGAAGACLAALVSVFSLPIVSLLFQRGAFDADMANQVAGALSHLAPGMAAMLAGVILMRALFCIPHSFEWAAAIGVGWSLIYFVLSGLFVDRGVVGLADAYSMTWIVVVIVASLVLWARAVSIGIEESAEC